MLKKYLKNTKFWIWISYSSFYQRLRNPVDFRKMQDEKYFYSELIKGIPGRGKIIFDVGANTGQKSAIFSKLAKTVIAFEPSEKLYHFLTKRFKNSNVKLFKCALGSSISNLDYYEIEGNEGYNSLSKKHIETTVTTRDIASIDKIKHNKVKVEIIENFIKKFGEPSYIKIDVEGFELEVIKGLKTPVSLISFEANLPEFCEESVQIIEYLTNISSNKYSYNFTVENSFLLKEFITKEDAIKYLLAIKYNYVEVYAKLVS